MTRSDIRGYVRDNLYESTADLVTDAQINTFINQELRSLPRKGIYLQEIWQTSTVVDQPDYSLPSGTYKIEKVQRNVATSAVPIWEEIKGWELFNGTLYFAYAPNIIYTMRAWLRKSFTDLTDDVTATDIPDDKTDVLVQGVLYRCLKMVVQYFLHARNWDALAKPDGIHMSELQGWLRDAKADYMSLIQLYRTVPKPREIDLVS